ncbi:MAG: 16S rRNA (uracil(1498)-N(3))-methyltransferase [Burkholderiaceae bacterium]
MIPRVYLPPESQQQARVELDPEQSLYLCQALRLKAGESIQVFDGLGGRRSAKLVQANRKSCEISLGPSEAGVPAGPLNITLIQGIAQGDRMDWVIEKAVELGVRCIVPVQTRRAQVRLSDDRAGKRVKHWRRIAVAACRQSGRDDLPVIKPVNALRDALDGFAPASGPSAHFVLQPESLSLLSTAVNKKTPAPQAVSLLIGPESGLADDEVHHARDQQWQAVGLGPRVLRTETAGLVAVSIVQAAWGDLASCAKPSI